MTTAPARVFTARLAGLAVYDPNGDLLGRARDVVVALRLGASPPRVLGLVLEVQRRRIFVPMGRIKSMDAGQIVLTTGRVSLKRFEQRVGETLVLTELLDRKVTLLRSGQEVTLVDTAMTQNRGEWLLTQAAVREGGRRGRVQTVGWDEVSGLHLEGEGQGAANMLAAFEKLRPADLATVMHDLSAKRRGELAAALDDERLADVLEEMPEDQQVAILDSLENERAADVLEAMSPDDAADLLAELPIHKAEELLELMEPEEAAPVRRLLSYADETAGGIMTSEPIILPPNATVAEALARVRNRDVTPALASQVYITRSPTETPTGKYLGVAHLQRLLREVPSDLVSMALDSDIDPLKTDASLVQVTRHLATYNLVAAPVVDGEGRLVGAVTVDDVLDHILPADWRDRDPREGALNDLVTEASHG